MLISVDRSDGRVMVLAKGKLDVPCIKVGGAWEEGTFSPDDLKDNFERVTDSKEADAFFQEAAAWSKSRPSRSKA